MEENRNSKSPKFDQIKCEGCEELISKPSRKIADMWLCKSCRWNSYEMDWSEGVYPDILEEDVEADLHYYQMKKMNEED